MVLKTRKPKVALVLGGGGARGLAHIGVLKILEENNIPIDIIAGTSIGALIGGLYISGVSPDKLETLTLSVDKKFVLKLFAPSLPISGFVDGENIREYLKSFLGETNIEQLKIPFAAVATDLKTGKEIVFRKGSVLEAIMASIAIPVLFKPAYYQDRFLCDGGLINPLPISVAPKLGADIIIDVNVEKIPTIEIQKNIHKDNSGIFNLDKAIATVRSRLHWQNHDKAGQPGQDNELTAPANKSKSQQHPQISILRVLMQSISIMECNLIAYRLIHNKPDVLISVPTGKFELLEFYHADELIKLGKRAALKAIPSITAKISGWSS